VTMNLVDWALVGVSRSVTGIDLRRVELLVL